MVKIISKEKNKEIIKISNADMNVIIYMYNGMGIVLNGNKEVPYFICGISKKILLDLINGKELSSMYYKVMTAEGYEICNDDDLYHPSITVMNTVDKKKKHEVYYKGFATIDKDNMHYTFRFEDGESVCLPFDFIYKAVNAKKDSYICMQYGVTYLITGADDYNTIKYCDSDREYIIPLTEEHIDIYKIIELYDLVYYPNKYLHCSSIRVVNDSCDIGLKIALPTVFNIIIRLDDMLDLLDGDTVNAVINMTNHNIVCQISKFNDCGGYNIDIDNPIKNIRLKLLVIDLTKQLSRAIKSFKTVKKWIP